MRFSAEFEDERQGQERQPQKQGQQQGEAWLGEVKVACFWV